MFDTPYSFAENRWGEVSDQHWLFPCRVLPVVRPCVPVSARVCPCAGVLGRLLSKVAAGRACARGATRWPLSWSSPTGARSQITSSGTKTTPGFQETDLNVAPLWKLRKEKKREMERGGGSCDLWLGPEGWDGQRGGRWLGDFVKGNRDYEAAAISWWLRERWRERARSCGRTCTEGHFLDALLIWLFSNSWLLAMNWRALAYRGSEGGREGEGGAKANKKRLTRRLCVQQSHSPIDWVGVTSNMGGWRLEGVTSQFPFWPKPPSWNKHHQPKEQNIKPTIMIFYACTRKLLKALHLSWLLRRIF